MSKPLKYKSVKGMPDVLPANSGIWLMLEDACRQVLTAAGFQQIRTPILEQIDLFAKSVGEGSDIVQKEMYTLIDQGGRELVLRPEGTASTVRSLLQHSLLGQGDELRLWYCGPMFRQENTQKGRQRQFHQIGVEVYGSSSPLVDAEIIALNVHLLRVFGIAQSVVKINSLGDSASRQQFREALVIFLDKNLDSICPDCISRKETNPLRVLDCKQQQCQQLYRDSAPVPQDYLSDASKENFKLLTTCLSDLGISYQVDRYLVRGLDYYTDTVFEIHSDQLGAQSAVSAGGRYDNLVESMGGQPTPAFGFAAGIERLLMICSDKLKSAEPLIIAWIALDQEARKEGVKWVTQARAHLNDCVTIHFPHKGSLKAQMRAANQKNVRFVVLRGEEERNSGQWLVKDLADGSQVMLPDNFEQLQSHITT